MKQITRFNPTSNGPLHLGHLYITLFNEYAARSTGGKFWVRIDDNGIDSLWSHTADEMQAQAESQYLDLVWMGFDIFEIEYQSQIDARLKEFIAHHGWFVPEHHFPFSLPLNPACGDYNPELGEWFPYAPYLTYNKVCYDEMEGINCLIRGDDLRSEFSLYQHYRAQLGLSELIHYYLPRIYTHDDKIVSKFHGARAIPEYREAGWTPKEIKSLLAESALRDPSQGWQLMNVKRYPRLDKEFSI